MEHRGIAQKNEGLTIEQEKALKLGRYPGKTAHKGFKHSEIAKKKISESNILHWKMYPERRREAGLKNRGENHYKWKGGSSRLNKDIRRLSEHRKWMDLVKERDKFCVNCGACEDLESHHIVELSSLLSSYDIKNREEARNCPALWDINNGETLCRKCHCARHGKTYIKRGAGRRANKRKNIQDDAA